MPKENKGLAGNKAVKTPIEGYDGLFSLKHIRRNEETDRRTVETIIRDADRNKPDTPIK